MVSKMMNTENVKKQWGNLRKPKQYTGRVCSQWWSQWRTQSSGAYWLCSIRREKGASGEHRAVAHIGYVVSGEKEGASGGDTSCSPKIVPCTVMLTKHCAIHAPY
ncbi:uncharacterized protein [Amphiura filiformis]|uniref:uncharacterized protein n=1 Tax=Amphiura filiformis TaxID=82378 RepID=UPI003B2260FE